MRIDRRFNGPPDSGNGGYVCGELAGRFDAKTQAAGVRVRLRKPPPLETELEIRERQSEIQSESGWTLNQGDDVLAEAWPETLEIELPEPVSVDRAAQAAKLFRGHEEHVFPTCFVCGPARSVGDGLRIFPGPLDDSEPRVKGAGPTFAATWMPDATLRAPANSNQQARRGDSPAVVHTPFIWAALDCPGCFSFPQPENKLLLLGELTAAIRAQVPNDEMTVLLSWRIAHEGRKHITGSAAYSASGECLGFSRGTWIEIPST